MIFARAPATPLSRSQLAWLAALVVLAQVPLWTHLRLWIVVAGSGLVAARIMLPADRPPPERLRRWLLPVLALAVGVGIRLDFGYFMARDPCVAFLYVLVGIKFVEAKSPRGAACWVPRAVPRADQLFKRSHRRRRQSH